MTVRNPDRMLECPTLHAGNQLRFRLEFGQGHANWLSISCENSWTFTTPAFSIPPSALRLLVLLTLGLSNGYPWKDGGQNHRRNQLQQQNALLGKLLYPHRRGHRLFDAQRYRQGLGRAIRFHPE